MKKYQILMCRVCSPLDALPFLSKSMALLLLSCSKRFWVTPYPWAVRKYWLQTTIGIMLSTPTSSLSVELCVFNFCLVELTIGNPLPIVNPPLVWLHILGCTANEASTCHINTPLPSALRIRGWSLLTGFHPSWITYLRYCNVSKKKTMVLKYW